MDKQSLLKLYNEQVRTFSEEQLNDVASFFGNFYSEKFITSRDNALDILLNDGLARALGKLDKAKQQQFKQKFLSL